MKRYLLAAAFVTSIAIAGSSDASAQFGGGNFGFAPFGFYQPFGAQYSTSIRTPPYFATNPPVYYGARHARPYGLSPFAAPPQVQAARTIAAACERTSSSRPCRPRATSRATISPPPRRCATRTSTAASHLSPAKRSARSKPTRSSNRPSESQRTSPRTKPKNLTLADASLRR